MAAFILIVLLLALLLWLEGAFDTNVKEPPALKEAIYQRYEGISEIIVHGPTDDRNDSCDQGKGGEGKNYLGCCPGICGIFQNCLKSRANPFAS